MRTLERERGITQKEWKAAYPLYLSLCDASGIPHCQRCSLKSLRADGTWVQLQLNHIDGNYKNNKTNNWEWICPICHQLDEHSNRSKDVTFVRPSYDMVWMAVRRKETIANMARVWGCSSSTVTTYLLKYALYHIWKEKRGLA